MSVEEELKKLNDRLEIDDLLVRYIHAIDAKKWDLLDKVFTPDAEVDYTSSGGIAGSYPEIKAWLAQVLSMFPVTQHLIGKSVVELNGDTANTTTLFHNPMVLPVNDKNEYDAEGSGTSNFFVGGWYEDVCVRTPEGWRISKRVEKQGYMEGAMPKGFGV